jgi:glutaredoxin-dependent peroxiredoxin
VATAQEEIMIERKTRTPAVGEKAPGFTLKDSDMKQVSLDDYRGKTAVLAFFPAAFSSVCTMELCAFRDHMAELNDLDTFVIGISVDLPYTIREFRRANHIGFPLLSDFDGEAIRIYGVVDEDFEGYHSGVAQRSVFVVDPKGTIAWRWIAAKPTNRPDVGDVYLAVESIGR